MNANGTFCWIELGTSDAPAARNFYTQLFAWTVNEIPMGEMGTYYIFQKGGRDAAAMYQIGPQQAGMPPNWLSYVAVQSADESTEKAKNAGGNVVHGPFDVYDKGRMSLVSDPQGAMFVIWESKASNGVEVRNEVNTLCWNELQARDLDAAKKFYPALFGWTLKDSPEYTEFHLDGKGIGGMIASQAPAQVPSYWLPYFAVEDCDAAAARIESLGGRLMMPPMDIPDVGRFTVASDPQGAAFAIIKLTM
ncbi:MAG TPA: VOC family protein [Thermoanaerobaculia bacterium]|nr:VOC family protein [Thermoanaerobaculia bacterium]